LFNIYPFFSFDFSKNLGRGGRHQAWSSSQAPWLSGSLFMTYLSLSLQPFFGPLAGIFSFLILYTVGRTPWTGDQPVARPLPTHRMTQTQNKRTHTPLPWVGFELTIPAFERAKAVHDLDRAATVVSFFVCDQCSENVQNARLKTCDITSSETRKIRCKLFRNIDSSYTVQSYWVCFGLYPSSCMWKTKDHNVSETGSVSSD
jgi:hypothetical protein